MLPDIRRELHLSYALAGVLGSIPVVTFAAASIPGALLVSRFGPRRIVAAGLCCLGACGILRAAPPAQVNLFLWTVGLALSIAVVQPALVAIVRAWFPSASQQASAAYATSVNLGGLAGAALTIHLLGFGGWRGTFLLWAVPALLAGLAWFGLAPGRDAAARAPHGLGRLVRDPVVWYTALLFGAQSLVYFSAATWVPFLVRRRGEGYLAVVLFALNVTTAPTNAVLAAIRWPWASTPAFYVAAGLLMLLGTLGLALGQLPLAWLFAALIGLSVGMVFSGTTAIPAVHAGTTGDVSGFTALVLSTGYSVAVLGPLLGGLLVDWTGLFTAPFWLMVGAAIFTVALGAGLPARLRVPGGD